MICSLLGLSLLFTVFTYHSILQKELLARIRRENARTEYEDRNCGRFKRIFPPNERFQQDKYARLLYSAFTHLVIGAGKNGAAAREIERQYMKKYRVSLLRITL